MIRPRRIGRHLWLSVLTLSVWMLVWIGLIVKDIRRLRAGEPALPGWGLVLVLLVCSNWHWGFAAGIWLWSIYIHQGWCTTLNQASAELGQPIGKFTRIKTFFGGILYVQWRLNQWALWSQYASQERSRSA